MNIAITIIFLGLLIQEGYGQDSEKQHVFIQSDTVYLDEHYDSMMRFSPSSDDVNTADSLAEIRVTDYMKDYVWASSDYKSYYRQYVGYVNDQNKRIIFINSFCRPVETWRKHLVHALGGGQCWINMKIALDTKRTFDFNVNAPK